jgi:hypothetical protein
MGDEAVECGGGGKAREGGMGIGKATQRDTHHHNRAHMYTDRERAST